MDKFFKLQSVLHMRLFMRQHVKYQQALDEEACSRFMIFDWQALELIPYLYNLRLKIIIN